MPGDRVDVTQDRAQALADQLQQAIANRVAQAVVDLLETVKVDKQQGADVFLVIECLAVQRLSQSCLEQGAIGQTGQRVMVGLMVESRLGVLERCDVAEHRNQMAQAAVDVKHLADVGPGGVEFAVGAAVPGLSLPVPLFPDGARCLCDYLLIFNVG